MSTVIETGTDERERFKVFKPDWQILGDDQKVYQCKVVLRSEDGVFSVYAATLPGVASQGATVEKALENIKEAIAGAISVYREGGGQIPWVDASSELAEGEKAKWIVVNA